MASVRGSITWQSEDEREIVNANKSWFRNGNWCDRLSIEKEKRKLRLNSTSESANVIVSWCRCRFVRRHFFQSDYTSNSYGPNFFLHNSQSLRLGCCCVSLFCYRRCRQVSRYEPEGAHHSNHCSGYSTLRCHVLPRKLCKIKALRVRSQAKNSPLLNCETL